MNETVQPVKPSKSMDTSQQLKHVFGCRGTKMHLTPGFMVLRQADPTKCAECGQLLDDVSNTPVGKGYLDQARFDLGERPS